MKKSDLKALHFDIGRMTIELFAAMGIQFNETTELQRQLLESFAFGMTFAIGQLEKLTPAEVRTLAIGMLLDGFKLQ
jgi:hypothetical protein